jgi:hypothetical protein
VLAVSVDSISRTRLGTALIATRSRSVIAHPPENPQSTALSRSRADMGEEPFGAARGVGADNGCLLGGRRAAGKLDWTVWYD